MQTRIWTCTQRPDEKALQKAAAACVPLIARAVLAALRARGQLTAAEFRRCSALLVQPLP